MVKTFNRSGADAFELNFSCPNGMPEKGIGMAIGTSAEISAKITGWVKEVAELPVFVKLTPNVTNIVEIAKAVEDAGADGFAAINTVQSLMGIDLESFEPLPKVNGKSTYGGYSGMAVKPIGLRCVAQLRQNSRLPILGMGGISTWSDAAEYMTVGADVVQVCTEVMINGYGVIKGMLKGMEDYLERKGFSSPEALRDKAIANLTEHKNLPKTQQAYPQIDEQKCIRCGKCVNMCDESECSALSLVNGKIEVDKDKCVGCSLCSHVCPKFAVTMK
jgi:dihydropyrimidine dehydrogenase (NAD+) subunit PreA